MAIGASPTLCTRRACPLYVSPSRMCSTPTNNALGVWNECSRAHVSAVIIPASPGSLNIGRRHQNFLGHSQISRLQAAVHFVPVKSGVNLILCAVSSQVHCRCWLRDVKHEVLTYRKAKAPSGSYRPPGKFKVEFRLGSAANWSQAMSLSSCTTSLAASRFE
mgnify:CR=1 FL=1